MMKVAVGGPPQSGKSTFTASLIKAIRSRKRRREFNISFTWVPLDVTDNSIATLLNPYEEIDQKRDVEWTLERAEERQAVFEARDERLVLADSPGLITDELRTVIAPADAMIVLCNYENREKISDWREMAEGKGIDIFAELTTILHEDIEPGWDDRKARIGTIQSVEREEFEDLQIDALDDTTHRMIRQLATDLLKESDG